MMAKTDWGQELRRKPGISQPEIQNGNKRLHPQHDATRNAASLISREQEPEREKPFDDKIEQILEFYANEQFHHPLTAQKLRLSMVTWSLRMKVISSLKRLLDVSTAALILVLALPVMALTALAIRLESPGPIVFKQMRVGKWGEPFTCYKFRSMYVDAEARKQALMDKNEADGPVFKIQHDPRITRVGRIIRKLSIDELPQLINVMKGEMSIVGPRPPLPSEVSVYKFDQMRRLEAIPGLTGLQQVSGRSDLDFKRWVELDMEYIAKQSIRQDLVIILKTIPAVLFGKGAY